MGTSAADHLSRYRVTTLGAGLARAPIDLMEILVTAEFSVGLDVVVDGGPPRFDGALQHRLGRCVKGEGLFHCEAMGGACWTEPRLKEGLVCVDVADARPDTLIEQGRLDGHFAFLECGAKGLGIADEGIGPKLVETRGALARSDPFKLSEFSHVAKRDGALSAQMEHGMYMSVLGKRARNELARHAQLQEQATLIIELSDEVLSYSAQMQGLSAGETSLECLRWCDEEVVLFGKLGADDSLALPSAGELTAYGFDFGQFGHRGLELISSWKELSENAVGGHGQRYRFSA